jgi:DNA polymerase
MGLAFGSIYVPAAGPLNAAVALLAQSPGTIEEEEGEPLVGPAGSLLQKAIKVATNIAWEDTYRTNVWKYRLLLSDTGEIKAEVNKMRPKVIIELMRLSRLRALILFGNEALYCVTRRWGITQERGRLCRWVSHPRSPLVIPTFHPAFVLRNRAEGRIIGGRTPMKWLLHDLRTAERSLR